MKTGTYVGLFVVLLFALPTAFAQEAKTDASDEWITVIDPTTTRLNARTAANARKLTDNKRVKKLHYVTMKAIHKAQQNGKLRFRIPGLKETIVAQASDIQTEDLANYTWHGEFEEAEGTMSFVSIKGVLRGHIGYNDKVYEIHSLEGSEVYGIAEMDFSEDNSLCPAPEMKEGYLDEAAVESSAPENGRVIACNTNVTRVLAFTTAAARTRDPNINQTIRLAFDQFNYARTQSFINSAQSQLVLTGIENFNLVEDPLDLDGDLDELRRGMGPRRDANDADLVVLFTAGDYNDGGGFIAGSAGALGPNPTWPLAIVEILFATADLTFTHEVGHLFGCEHQQCSLFNRNPGSFFPSCSDEAGYDHGFWYTKKPRFQPRFYFTTLMHQQRGGWTRQLRFSNPDVGHNGAAIGGAQNDNAREISRTANAIATFNQTGDLYTGIGGPSSLPAYSQGTWEAVIGCAVPPYQIRWETSYDGFNYSVAETQEFLSQVVWTSNYYIRLRVTDANGAQRMSFLTVYVTGGGSKTGEPDPVASAKNPWIELTDGQQDQLANQGGVLMLEAYPNPATSQTIVPFILEREQSLVLELTNALGQTVRVLQQGTVEGGYYEIAVGRQELAAGIYFYRLTTHRQMISKKLVIAD